MKRRCPDRICPTVVYLIQVCNPPICFQSSTGDSHVQPRLNTMELPVLQSSPASERQSPRAERALRLAVPEAGNCSPGLGYNLRGTKSVPFALRARCQLKPSSRDQSHGHHAWGRQSFGPRAPCLGFQNFLAGLSFKFLEFSNLLLKCITK